MFSNFLKFFNRTVQYDIYGNEYRTFVIAFGGMQFGKGLFNVFDKGDLRYWENNVTKMFPEYKGRFELFGYDWMGRCFAVTSLGADDEKILVFDPSTLEVSDIQLTFMDFINKAIPAAANECFSADAFINWYNTYGIELKYLNCLGNKVPLFLGGNDELDNMELSDMDVYWHILGQTAAKLKNEAEGTVIEEFTIEEEKFYANQANEAEDFFEIQKKRAPYIKKNVDKYLEKFKRMERKGSSISWNWCAFLFNCAWMFYRKMYGAYVLFMVLPYLAGGLAGFIIGLVFGLTDGSDEMMELVANIVGFGIGVVILFIPGMFGNSWYRRKIDKLVTAGENAVDEEARQKLLKKGGTNLVGLLVLESAVVLVSVLIVLFIF